METKDVARSRFSPVAYAAWVAMGERVCSVCGRPMVPCPKGPGADEPGFVGYYPCCNDGEPVASSGKRPERDELTQENYNAIRDHLFDCIHKTGEQVKNHFPNLLRAAIKAEAWKHFTDAEGKPFTNLVEWLHCTYPNGASLGQGKHALNYDETVKLTEGSSDVLRVLKHDAPSRRAEAQRDELLEAIDGAIRAIEEGECDIALLYLRAAVKRSGQGMSDGFVAVARELLEIAKRARTGECTCHDLPDTEFCDVCRAKEGVKKAKRWFSTRTG